MRGALAGLVVFAAIVVCAPAYATESPTPTPTVTPDTEDEGGFLGTGQASQHGDSNDGGTASTEQAATEVSAPGLPPGQWVITSPCDAMSNSGCQEFVGITCPGGEQAVIWSYIRDSDGGVETSGPGCPSDPPTTVSTPAVDIPGEALKEFKKVELPASTITVQPPGGETLVNFKTILSTHADRHQVTVSLENVKIDLVLEVWPSHFLWKHGDETTQETTHAGLKWTEGADVDSEGFVTHVYTQALKAAKVSVDTTWSAQFKVVGAADWRPVNGTVTKVGEPIELTVREATPELVTEPN